MSLLTVSSVQPRSPKRETRISVLRSHPPTGGPERADSRARRLDLTPAPSRASGWPREVTGPFCIFTWSYVKLGNNNRVAPLVPWGCVPRPLRQHTQDEPYTVVFLTHTCTFQLLFGVSRLPASPLLWFGTAVKYAKDSRTTATKGWWPAQGGWPGQKGDPCSRRMPCDRASVHATQKGTQLKTPTARS